ncbi:MAG: DNA gyrase subunit A [Chitinispirillales bacterium]|nr:DNA gyrase subunit A [Chitinispirillales bacterium]
MDENEENKFEEQVIQNTSEGIISPTLLEEEMKRSMLDYAMSVITARALPDARDGLKPVHRRILYSMHENGWTASLKDHIKCAKVVGAVMGDYHPHGDSSIYEALVRMSQPWSLRYCAIDFHGGNGSIDGDKPAAYRYTECKLDKMADEMLIDINKNVVDMAKNFSEDKDEPIVLPSRIPFLLVNGSSGIAVGMATNMAPHNLREVVLGIKAVLENSEIEIDDLIKYIPAPDFPTGGLIYGRSGAIEAYKTGRGKIIMRAKAEIVGTDASGQGGKIIITEIPYMLSKENLVKKMEELASDKENGISGIMDIEDESSDIDDSDSGKKKGAQSKIGIRIIVHVKRDDYAEVVLNQLYKMSPLQSSFGILNLALVRGRPHLLNLKQLIEHYIDHRLEVITRKTQFDLNKAKNRSHIVDGLIVAADNTDEVIKIIRSSEDEANARITLQERFNLDEIQSKAITDMRLGLLTRMNRLELENEKKDLLLKIADFIDILDKRERKVAIINEDLDDILKKYGDDRRSQIVDAAGDIDIEDMIPNEDMVITMTHAGYIKRTAADTYKTQGRGGRGLKGMASKDSDFIETLFVASAHSTILFFTDKGRCYGIKVWELPEGDRTSKGRPIVNVIEVLQTNGEKVASFVVVKDYDNAQNQSIVQVTQRGIINRQPLENYQNLRKNGLNSIKLDEKEELVAAVLCEKDDNVVIASSGGNAVRFPIEKARITGRNTHGVRGIRLKDGDKVIGMITAKSDDDKILTVTENGFGKRTKLGEYRITNRGGKGIINIKTSERNGKVINIMNPNEDDDLLIITKNGIIIRVCVAKINVIGRATQGVKLMNLDTGDKVIDVSDCGKSDDDGGDIEKSELPQTNPEDLLEEEIIDEDDDVKEEADDGESDE